tara:strand:+ start:2297 stop:2749 length:453 start_codon:yes stop_codon:yes gene_type:complete
MEKSDVFDTKVSMYVHEEMIDGVPLTKIINETNENVKYLKGAKFTPNVVAEPDIAKACEGATMICFCLPHQFLKPIMPKIKVRRRRRRASSHAQPPPRPLSPPPSPPPSRFAATTHLARPLAPLRRRRRRRASSASLPSRASTLTTRASC